MIRNVVGALLVVMTSAGAVQGESITAQFLKAWGSNVTISASGTIVNGGRTVVAGPYEYLLSTNSNSGDEATKLVTAQGTGSTITYCFDLYQYVSNSPLSYDINELSEEPYPPFGNGVHLDSKKIGMIERLFEYAGSSATLKEKTIQGHALTIAIWETVYEHISLTGLTAADFDVNSYQDDTGFKVVSWDSTTWLNEFVENPFGQSGQFAKRKDIINATANFWLANAFADPAPHNLLRALTNSSAQNQCLLLPPEEGGKPNPVPEPALAIQLLGLCVAGALPLRYWRRGRKGVA